ncbi:MAG: efflux RND transporter periplasmic adaptor subunit [Acidobacteriota bacterium]|nr:efflux RND transporter periplasmic adaptor subunit [Acidobacteriota bacterium]
MNSSAVFVLVPVFVCSMGCTHQAPVQAKQDSGPIRIQAVPVVLKQIQRTVESVGSLFPFEEVVISSEIEGRVEQVGVDLGDRVAQGQVLVRVSDEEQRYLLAQNEAQLRQALERLGLKDENERVKDIKLTPEVRRATADLYDAEQRFNRTRELVTQGIGSRQDLDQAQSHFQALQAQYETTMNTVRNLIQEVQRYRGAVDLQRKKLRDTTIRAPFAAQVKERVVNVGQYVRPNTPVFTLVKIDPIRLRIEVPERMAPWIRNGLRTSVSMEAFPERVFEGKVWRIAPTVEQSKRTFIVEALIANPKGELKPGSYAKATVKTEKFDTVKLVPAKALNYVFGANKVYVVQQGKIDAREVVLGDRLGTNVEISKGVEDGELVATSQLTRLDTGTRVQVVSESEDKVRSKAD